MEVEVRVLGPLEVIHGGVVTGVGGPKPRTVLAMLVSNAGRTVSVDTLLEAAYGSSAHASAKRSVHTYVSGLRKVFGEAIHAASAGYTLDPDRVDIDIFRFEQGCRKAESLRHVRPRQSVQLYGGALELWRSSIPYEDIDAYGLLEADRTKLTEMRLAAMVAKVDLELTLGGRTDLVAELRDFVVEYPLIEPFTAQLMLALYRSGRPTEALRAFDATRMHLAEEIGVDPSPLLELLQRQILSNDPQLLRQVSPVRLPSRTSSFIGRDQELRRLSRLVLSSRLVTVTGGGGVGKTSLAHEAAREIGEGDTDVVVVDLSGAESESDVVANVAQGIGLDEWIGSSLLRGLIRTIGSGETLLVLDTCEHVVRWAAKLAAELLAGCPNLRVLATSRRSLRLRGEAVFELGPLPVEVPDGYSPAARLFSERVRLVLPGFELDSRSAPIVQLIVSRLDGVPLALEIAAARARWFGLEKLIDAIDDQGGSLLGESSNDPDPRHSSLARSIEWSVELLGEQARRGFAALSVFVTPFDESTGGFVLDAIALGDVRTAVLVELIDASLLVVEGQDFRMLDLVREYARRLLEQSPDVSTARSAHAELLLGQLSAVAPSRRSYQGRFKTWEVRNLRSAIVWAIEAEPQMAIRLAAEAGDWYWSRGPRAEGYELLRDVAAGCEILPNEDGHRLSRELAMMATYFGDEGLARSWSARCTEIAESLGKPMMIASSLKVTAFVLSSRGDNQSAVNLNQRALAMQVSGGSANAVGTASNLANLAWYRADADEVEAQASEIGRLASLSGLADGSVRRDVFRAKAAWVRGDLERAESLLTGALQDFAGGELQRTFALQDRARVRAWCGKVDEAEKDLDAVAEVMVDLGTPLPDVKAYVGLIRSRILRTRGDRTTAARTLQTVLEECKEALTIHEFRLMVIPDSLSETIMLLAGAEQHDVALGLAGVLDHLLLDVGRKLETPVRQPLDGQLAISRESMVGITDDPESTRGLHVEAALDDAIAALDRLAAN